LSQAEYKILALEQELAVLRNLVRAPPPPEAKVQPKFQTRPNPNLAASKAEVLKAPPQPTKRPTPVSPPAKPKKKTAKIPWVQTSKHSSSQVVPLKELSALAYREPHKLPTTILQHNERTDAHKTWPKFRAKVIPSCPPTRSLKEPSANTEEKSSCATTLLTEEAQHA